MKHVEFITYIKRFHLYLKSINKKPSPIVIVNPISHGMGGGLVDEGKIHQEGGYSEKRKGIYVKLMQL